MPPLANTNNTALLRTFFSDSDYSQEGLRNVFSSGVRGEPAPRINPADAPMLARRSRGAGALGVLADCFSLGLSVESKRAKAAVPEDVLIAAIDSGLLEADGDSLKPTVAIATFDDRLIAMETAEVHRKREIDNLALPVNATTHQLFSFLIRSRSRRSLEIGCGPGPLTLHASRFSDTVTGADINPRALAYSRFNAALNGVEGVSFCQADAMTPFRGEFDRIFSNPPYYITPGNRLLYCENPDELDGFCERLTRQAIPLLSEGGYFQMLMDWVEVKGEVPEDRIRRWVEGSGCDALLIRRSTRSLDESCWRMLRETEPDSTKVNAEQLEEWVQYFQQRNVRAVHGGMLALRKRSGRNWFRSEQTQERTTARFGDVVERMFEGYTYSAQVSNNDLLDTKPTLVGGAKLEKNADYQEGRWIYGNAFIRSAAGRGMRFKVDPSAERFLERLNGRKTLREVVRGIPDRPGVSRENLTEELVSLVRRLLEFGHVTLAA